jgi:hypothetical protein
VSLLHVGTLETGNDGSAQTHILHNVDQTLGDGVTADDTTEDVDEDGRHLGVAGDQLEGALDGSGGGTTADVKEVGRAAAVQLDDIHSGHGKTGTVDYIFILAIESTSRIVGGSYPGSQCHHPA